MKINKDFDMDYFNKLPEGITGDILSRVPGESALHCKLVCINWRSIVSKDPSFPHKHLYYLNHPSAAAVDSCKLCFFALTMDDYYYFEYNDDHNHELSKPIKKVRRINSNPFGGTYLVGSCNGLVFLSPGFIWNPLTKEYVELPDIENHLNGSDGHDEYLNWSYGFGYVSETNEYKVVATYVSQSKYVQVHIYTVGSGNGWRNIGKFNSEFSPMCYLIRGYGKFANGAIYWISREVDKIVTFDLMEEKFCQHPAHPPLKPGWRKPQIGVLDGFLYIAIYDEGDGSFDIWLLKKKNGNHDKEEGDKHQSFEWSKELRVDEMELVAVTKNGDILTYSSSDHYLNFYDMKTSTPKTLMEFKEQIIQIFPHKNTFVSLKELGEQDTHTIESVEPLKQLQEDAIPKCVNIEW